MRRPDEPASSKGTPATQRSPWWRRRRQHRTVAPARRPSEDLTAEVAIVERVRLRHHDRVVSFGAPCRCPACASYALVVRVDSRAGRSFHHCACGARFELTRRALSATSRSTPGDPQPPAPIRGGVLIEALFSSG